MTIWSREIKDLERLHESFKGQHPKLDRELEKLVATNDENIVLVYARRCLEVILMDLCIRKLKRPRGTEPLKGIIDKLNREEMVPNNIIVSMQNLNSLSTFGAHPKDFDPKQVKPVILDLTTVLEWYLNYLETLPVGEKEQSFLKDNQKSTTGLKKSPLKKGKSIKIIAGIVLTSAIIVVALILFDFIGSGKIGKAGSIGSIVVLPFSNYTGQDTLEYFVSGMHSDLITEICKISNLRTISSTSSKIYKGADKSITQIASELKVDAAIETDVLCFGGDTICWQVRLISKGPEEKQLWVGDFKEGKNNIFKLYHQVTKQIADQVKVSLTSKEEILLSETKPVNQEAYDALLKARYYWSLLDEEGLKKALEYYNLAMEKDPTWAFPYAGLAEYWVGLKQMGFISPAEADPMIHENINKALEMDPNSAYIHYVNALVAVWTDWDWEKGESEFIKVLGINPNDAYCRIYYSHFLMALGKIDDALSEGRKGLDLDPLNPLIQTLYAAVLFDARKYESAIDLCESALRADPGNFFASWILSIAAYFSGDSDKTFEALQHTLPFEADIIASINNKYQEKGFQVAIEMIVSLLEDLANDGYILPYDMATKYLMLEDPEKLMEWLTKGFELHDPNMPYMYADFADYDPVRNDPRFIELLKKMNLPAD